MPRIFMLTILAEGGLDEEESNEDGMDAEDMDAEDMDERIPERTLIEGDVNEEFDSIEEPYKNLTYLRLERNRSF